jgi:opacity protein-like surface antigen
MSLPVWQQDRTWHPVIAFGAGASTVSNLGKSQGFPIQNPDTDQFYNYVARDSTQTATLFDFFLGAEWQLRQNCLLQAGVDYNQVSSFDVKGSLTQGVDVISEDNYTYHYSLSSKQLLAQGKLLYTIKEHYHPYVLVGVGAAFNKAYNFTTSVPPNLTFTRMYQNNTTTSFSYAVGLGLDIDATAHLRVGIGYRFIDLGKAKLGDATLATFPVAGTLSQDHLYANQLLAQLTFVV